MDANTELKLIRSAMRAMPIIKSESWLEMVRKEPCCLCGSPPPNDPHHIALGYHGCKSSDLFTVPLCRKCHIEKGERIEYFVNQLLWVIKRMDERLGGVQ